MIEQNSMKQTNKHEYTSIFHLLPEAMFIITTIQTKAKYVTILPIVRRTALENRNSSPNSRHFLIPNIKSHTTTENVTISHGIMCSNDCAIKLLAITEKPPGMLWVIMLFFILSLFVNYSYLCVSYQISELLSFRFARESRTGFSYLAVIAEPRTPFTFFQVVRIVLVEFGFHLKCARSIGVGVYLTAAYYVVCKQVVHEAYKPFCQIKNVVE
nr:MAG TPA: hypothetical protein [Caudoviricetes sp.]